MRLPSLLVLRQLGAEIVRLPMRVPGYITCSMRPEYDLVQICVLVCAQLSSSQVLERFCLRLWG